MGFKWDNSSWILKPFIGTTDINCDIISKFKNFYHKGTPADLNNVIENGAYLVTTSCKNRITGHDYGILLVFTNTANPGFTGNDWYWQIYLGTSGPEDIWIRSSINQKTATWSSWVKVLTSSSFSLSGTNLNIKTN